MKPSDSKVQQPPIVNVYPTPSTSGEQSVLPSGPSTPRPARLHTLAKDRDRTARQIFELIQRIAHEERKTGLAATNLSPFITELRTKKQRLEQQFKDIVEEIRNHPPVDYTADFPSPPPRRTARRHRAIFHTDGAVPFPENTSTPVATANAESPEEEAANRALEDSFNRANEALTNTDTAEAIVNTLTTPAHQLADTTNTGAKPKQPTSSRIFFGPKAPPDPETEYEDDSENSESEPEYIDASENINEIIDEYIEDEAEYIDNEEVPNEYNNTTIEIHHEEEENNEETVEEENLEETAEEEIEEEDDNMALTLREWQNHAQLQARAITNGLTEGFNSISAHNFKREIPEFTGDLDESMPIDEWFKLADKIGTTAGWTDPQRLIYYKARLTKSAANYSDALDPLVAADYDDWRQAMLNGFQDCTLKNLRKDQLKHLKQRQHERVRDFRKRIDETYRNAYGPAVDDSPNNEVITLKNEIKKEALLNGLRAEITTLIWGRLPNNATYAQTADTATQCEQIIELRRTTEARTIGQVLEAEKREAKSEIDEIKALIQQMANLKISPVNNPPGPIKTIAYVEGDNSRYGRERVRFADEPRSRSVSPRYQSYRKPPPGPAYYNSQRRSQSPRWNNQSYDQQQERENRTCYFCKNRGHIKRACNKYKSFLDRRRNGQDQETMRMPREGNRRN